MNSACHTNNLDSVTEDSDLATSQPTQDISGSEAARLESSDKGTSAQGDLDETDVLEVCKLVSTMY